MMPKPPPPASRALRAVRPRLQEAEKMQPLRIATELRLYSLDVAIRQSASKRLASSCLRLSKSSLFCEQLFGLG
jgi:hypothetical protein